MCVALLAVTVVVEEEFIIFVSLISVTCKKKYKLTYKGFFSSTNDSETSFIYSIHHQLYNKIKDFN